MEGESQMLEDATHPECNSQLTLLLILKCTDQSTNHVSSSCTALLTVGYWRHPTVPENI